MASSSESDSDSGSDDAPATGLSLTGTDGPPDAPRLPFPPLTIAHVLACSYTTWHPIFRAHTPKARLIPLSRPFLAYLRADGIVLPPSPTAGTPRGHHDADDDEGFFSSSGVSSASSDDDANDDVSAAWPDVHAATTAAIGHLGGRVVPKLNWSAPKDAAWIGATNSLDCRAANDVYLLLKSSAFVTFDLDHALDGCVDWDPAAPDKPARLDAAVPYALVLRKRFELNPALEFRVFVRAGVVLGLTQRDGNHYAFLAPLRARLKAAVLAFWAATVRDEPRWTAALGGDGSYAMDVYVPPPHDRVWIVDFAPWDRRTDPGLWSWAELLGMDVPDAGHRAEDGEEVEEVDGSYDASPGPELRLVRRDDPEAYMFGSARYSAHKLPRDVVDASAAGGGGLREFAERWREIVAREEAGGTGSWRRGGDVDSGDDDDDDDD